MIKTEEAFENREDKQNYILFVRYGKQMILSLAKFSSEISIP